MFGGIVLDMVWWGEGRTVPVAFSWSNEEVMMSQKILVICGLNLSQVCRRIVCRVVVPSCLLSIKNFGAADDMRGAV